MTLRTNRHTNHDIFRTVALAVTALVLFSCQNDSLEMEKDSNRITVYPVINRAIETTIQTRALEGNYTKDTIGMQSFSANAIAYGLKANTEDEWEHKSQFDQQGIFAPTSAGWRSTVKCEPGYRYYIYSYSRILPSQNNPTFSFTSESNVTLSFNGLDILTTNDPLVCVAAAAAVRPANSVPDLSKGSFNIGVIPSTVTQGNSFKAFLAYDHLYSKATLSFRIDETYNRIRKVHIKDVQIKLAQGTLSGTHVYNFFEYDQGLKLDNNRERTGDTASVNLFDGPTAKIQPTQDQNGNDYIELTTSLQEFGYYYFLPLNPTPSMFLEVTYDILDLKGNVVRENQTARNNNLFAAINYAQGKAAAGTNYNVKVLVSPTYLYQLSDDDLELGLTVE